VINVIWLDNGIATTCTCTKIAIVARYWSLAQFSSPHGWNDV